LLLLHQHWERHRLASAYNLAWIGPMARNTLEFARSQLEWMAGPLGEQFDTGKGHPLSLPNLAICSTIREWDQYLLKTGTGTGSETNPSVVLASGATLDYGPARDLFLRWSEDQNNAIILTDSRRCVLRGNILWDVYRQRKENEEEEKKMKKKLWIQNQFKNANNTANNNHPPHPRHKNRKHGRLGKTLRRSSTGGSSMASQGGNIIPVVDNDAIVETDINQDTQSTNVQQEENNDAVMRLPSPIHKRRHTISSSSSVVSMVEEDMEGSHNPTGSTTTTTTLNKQTPSSSSNGSKYSTAAQLLLKWCEAKAAGDEMDDVVEVDSFVPKRAPLSGRELARFLAEEEDKRLRARAEEERRAMLHEVELARGRLKLDQNETMVNSSGGGAGSGPNVTETATKDSAAEKNGVTTVSSSNTNTSATASNELRKRPKKKGRFDADLFLKFSKPCHMTFEVREEAVGISQSDSVAKYGIGESIGQAGEVLEDDYGISVKAERFTDIVSGVDPSKYNAGNGRIGEDVLKRGLGFGSDGRPLIGMVGAAAGMTKDGDPIMGSDMGAVGGAAGGNDAEVEMQELAIEAADLSEGRGIIRGKNGRPPIKVSTVSTRIEVFAEVVYIPIEGRVDSRAARQSVRALQPRHVVILGAGRPPQWLNFVSSDETTIDSYTASINGNVVGEAHSSTDVVRSIAFGEGSIFAPEDMEITQLSVGHAAYSVRLIDTPYISKEEKSAMDEEGEEEAQMQEPFEAKMGDCTVSILNCVATGQKVAADGSIVLAPRLALKHARRPNIMLSDGEVLLTDLRSEIIAQGIKAEYSAHTGYSQLILNGKIIVRKDQASGKILVEGPLCQDFFTVRSIVCGQYATL